MKDHYKTLRIKKEAKADEIKRAYFLLAKKYHPDSGETAEVKLFFEVSEAYQTLSDPQKRQKYDVQFSKKEASPGQQEDEKPTPYSRSVSVRTDPFRHKEKVEYHRQQVVKGVARVLLSVSLFGIGGMILGWFFFLGPMIGGVLAGAAFGLVLSLNRNFDVSSFFEDPRQYRLARLASRIVLFMSAAYFVVLFFLQAFYFNQLFSNGPGMI